MKGKGFLLLSLLTFFSTISQANAEDVYDFSENSDVPNYILKCTKPARLSYQAAKKVDACVFNIHQIGKSWDILIYPGNFKKVILDPGEYTITAAGHRIGDNDWQTDKFKFAAKYGRLLVFKVRVYSNKIVEQSYEHPSHEFSITKLTEDSTSEINISKENPEANLESLSFIELVESSAEKEQVKFETQQIANGVKLEITRSTTIQHTLDIDSKSSGSVNLSAKTGSIAELFASIEGEIKGELEKSLGQTFQDSETYGMKISLDGNISTTWEIYWYDNVHKGVAVFEDKNGKVYELPYTFRGVREIKVDPILKK